MILAAGLGTRLRPYTSVLPKPLFPILGRPLLLITIDKLRQAGFSPIIVNCHHLGSQIVEFLEDEDDIFIQRESAVLGTGGGLRMALPHLGVEPLLVTNGDIYHDVPYDEIYARHLVSGAKVSLVMHDFPRFNKVCVATDEQILGFPGVASPVKENSDIRELAFTGIHVVAPEVIKAIPGGCFFNIIQRYTDYMSHGGHIKAIELANILWHDIGTPADYLKLHADLLCQGGCLHDLQQLGRSMFYCGSGLQKGHDVILQDWGFFGSGVKIGDNVELKRVVAWDGAVIPDHSVLHDTIII